jgi:hypothetical protein
MLLSRMIRARLRSIAHLALAAALLAAQGIGWGHQHGQCRGRHCAGHSHAGRDSRAHGSNRHGADRRSCGGAAATGKAAGRNAVKRDAGHEHGHRSQQHAHAADHAHWPCDAPARGPCRDADHCAACRLLAQAAAVLVHRPELPDRGPFRSVPPSPVRQAFAPIALAFSARAPPHFRG